MLIRQRPSVVHAHDLQTAEPAGDDQIPALVFDVVDGFERTELQLAQ